MAATLPAYCIDRGIPSSVSGWGKKTVLVGLLLTLPWHKLLAKDFYVKPDTSNCDGRTGERDDPFCTIREALRDALSGDRIYLAPGKYRELLSWTGKDLTIVGSGIGDTQILAGFDGSAITVRGSTFELRGMTIRQGRASSGGGLNLEDCVARIVDCEFRENHAYAFDDEVSVSGGEGGAISLRGGFLSLSGCEVRENTTYTGGGIYFHEADLELEDCIFENNEARFETYFLGVVGFGGVMGSWAESANSVDVRSCRFQGNRAADGGAILFAQELASFRATSSVMFDNQDGEWFFVWRSQVSPELSFCTLPHMNTTGLVLDHCILQACWVPFQSLGHNCFIAPGDCTSADLGEGDLLGVDPLFVDPPSGDFRLSSASPCIDSGDPDQVFFGTDIDGLPRTLDGLLDGRAVVDRGAHEHHHCDLEVRGEHTPGGTVHVSAEGTSGLCAFLFVGTERGETYLPHYGASFVDPMAPWLLQFHGVIPIVRDLSIPPDLPTPASFVLQLLCVNTSLDGNFSNATDWFVDTAW